MESAKTPLLLHSRDSVSGSGMKRHPYSNADTAAQGQQTLQAGQARVHLTCSVRAAGRHFRGQHGPACAPARPYPQSGRWPNDAGRRRYGTHPHPHCRRPLAAPLPTHLPVPCSQGEPSRASRPTLREDKSCVGACVCCARTGPGTWQWSINGFDWTHKAAGPRSCQRKITSVCASL